MDNRDRLINDLAIENTKMRIDIMQLNYEIENLNKQIVELTQEKEGK